MIETLCKCNEEKKIGKHTSAYHINKEWWENLTPEQKEDFKELTIERLKRLPDNVRISIG